MYGKGYDALCKFFRTGGDDPRECSDYFRKPPEKIHNASNAAVKRPLPPKTSTAKRAKDHPERVMYLAGTRECKTLGCMYARQSDICTVSDAEDGNPDPIASRHIRICPI